LKNLNTNENIYLFTANKKLNIAIFVLAFPFYIFVLNDIIPNLKFFIADSITLSFFFFFFTKKGLHDHLEIFGVFTFSVLPAVLVLEAIFAGWKNCSIFRILFDRNESTVMDMALFVADHVFILSVLKKLMTFGITLAAGAGVNALISEAVGFDISLAALPIVPQILVAFILYTFFDYWTHRADHTSLFWPLHRFHHSATDFCALTTMRQHPGSFTSIFLIGFPMMVLGVPATTLVAVGLMVGTIGFLIHSNLDTDWGWFGRWVIQSPRHHRMHHSYDYEGREGHYAMMPIWDRLFGTYLAPDGGYITIGVSEPYRQGLWFWRDMLRDYFDFWKGLPVWVVRTAFAIVSPWLRRI